ncbi:hypothetical protein [Amycolatopsis pigmentata]|uniref:HTH cro/C1-type domain-containing protein n=1 Tax=Amycolatopsis pigmentata TaxID=450801 RepID=A0ABW5FKG1_9PSEU
MSEPDVPQRFLDLAKQAGGQRALTDTGLRERFGEPGEAEVYAGQVWRARWDQVSVLVLVLAVEDRDVLAAPVTVDPPVEDGHCLVVDGSSNTFGVDATVWAALATSVPVRVLERTIDTWSGDIARWISTTEGRSEPAPAGTRHGHGGGSELDPVASFRAELADDLESLQQAPGLPAETPGMTTQDLASLLGDRLDLALLCNSLGMRQPEVMKLLRGKVPLTLEQVKTVARVTGLAAEKIAQTVRPLPFGLVVAAEHPRWRHVWHERARRQHVSEAEARLSGSYGAFALAARETGGRGRDWDERLRRFLSDEELDPGDA